MARSANYLGYLVSALLTVLLALPGSRRVWSMAFTASDAASLSLCFAGGVTSAFVRI